MPAYFADTSAIVKLYLDEPGSDWIRGLELGLLVISTLAIPEAASAIARRRREQQISDDEALALWRSFRRDLRRWDLIALAQPLLFRAAALQIRPAPDGMLRTLDALQVACALEAQRRVRRAGIGPLTFLTADSRLELAARHAGLTVENPERYSA